MKKNIYILLTLLFGITCSSCEQDEMKDPYGYLSVNVAKDNSLISVSKATGSDRFLASVYIIKSGTRDTVYRNDDYTAMDAQRLLAGEYRVVVITDPATTGNFDAPVYKGETTIQLFANSNQTAKVVCTLANVKATVMFSEKIKANFIDYTAHVTDGVSRVDFLKDETRSAYFMPGELNLTVDLINNNGTEYKDIQLKNIPNTLPRQHYKLIIDVDDSNSSSTDQGGGNFSISVDETTNELECKYTIILNNEPRPVLTVPGVELITDEYNYLTGALKVAEGNGTAVQLTTTASYPISRLAISSDYFLETELKKEFVELTTASTAMKAQIKALGIDLPNAMFGERSAVIDFSSFTAKLPSLGTGARNHLLKVIVRDDHHQETELHLTFVVQPNGTANTQEANAWAKFAKLKGTCYAETRPEFLFKYRKLGELAWTTIPQDQLTIAEETPNNYLFTATATPLTPATTYEYMACTNANDGQIVEFTTEAILQIPNSNFDSWYKSGKNLYPNVDLSAENFWWDSGNEGANTLSENNPTSEEKTVVISGSACKMASTAVLGNFAAGNVYTGDFGKAVISGGAGATLSFGRPFASRPSKLKGYYKYTPGTVDYAKKGLNKGDSDECFIYIAVCHWSAPFAVNTSTNTFVNFDDPSVLGFGSLSNNTEISGASANGYQEFEIPVVYKDKDSDTKATYILVVATASRYGDYFTGSTKSVLYMDELELVYDEQN